MTICTVITTIDMTQTSLPIHTAPWTHYIKGCLVMGRKPGYIPRFPDTGRRNEHIAASHFNLIHGILRQTEYTHSLYTSTSIKVNASSNFLPGFHLKTLAKKMPIEHNNYIKHTYIVSPLSTMMCKVVGELSKLPCTYEQCTLHSAVVFLIDFLLNYCLSKTCTVYE